MEMGREGQEEVLIMRRIRRSRLLAGRGWAFLSDYSLDLRLDTDTGGVIWWRWCLVCLYFRLSGFLDKERSLVCGAVGNNIKFFFFFFFSFPSLPSWRVCLCEK